MGKSKAGASKKPKPPSNEELTELLQALAGRVDELEARVAALEAACKSAGMSRILRHIIIER
jgi:hypothetical protein